MLKTIVNEVDGKPVVIGNPGDYAHDTLVAHALLLAIEEQKCRPTIARRGETAAHIQQRAGEILQEWRGRRGSPPPEAAAPAVRIESTPEHGIAVAGPKAVAVVYDRAHIEPVIAALCRVTDDDPDDYTATELGAAAAGVVAGSDVATFQSRVATWMQRCFVPSLCGDMTERGDRLLEEVLEMLQAHGYDPSRVATLVQYVFGRPVGDPVQEAGGVMVTLAAYCWIAKLDMHSAGERELSRINEPAVMTKIRAKQEAKAALPFDTPLPGQVADSVAQGRVCLPMQGDDRG